MLLRVALSLVYLWYKQRVKSAPTASAATTPEARVEEISTQIIVLCQNCPVSIQTLLDMGFAIRNFKHSTINSLQKQFEDKVKCIESNVHHKNFSIVKMFTKVALENQLFMLK